MKTKFKLVMVIGIGVMLAGVSCYMSYFVNEVNEVNDREEWLVPHVKVKEVLDNNDMSQGLYRYLDCMLGVACYQVKPVGMGMSCVNIVGVKNLMRLCK